MVNHTLILIQQPTPYRCCIDINNLINIITHSQSDSISRLKHQVDGGKDFLNMSVNIISMHPNILSNFVVATGNAPENYHYLRELFTYSFIQKLFEIDIPIQVVCDLCSGFIRGYSRSIEQLLVLCTFCLWRNGSLCISIPEKARKHKDLVVDLVRERQ